MIMFIKGIQIQTAIITQRIIPVRLLKEIKNGGYRVWNFSLKAKNI
jgi:hypothetical protein